MSARAKRLLSTAVRLLIVLAAIAWLSRDPHFWSQLWLIVRSADLRFLLLGLVAFGPAPLLSVYRLKWLLAVHDIHLSTWEMVRITFAGNFLIWALPMGTSGGDAAKAYYIAQHTPHKHEAVTTVFFDRLVGLVGLILLSGTMVLLNWHNPSMAHWGRPIGLLAITFFAGATAYFSDPLRRVLHLDQILGMLPLGHHIQRVDRAVLAFRRHGRTVLAALALTVLLQVNAIICLYLVGSGLALAGKSPISALGIYLAYTPICFLTGALPLGVMEVTYEQLFVNTAHLGAKGAGTLLSLMSRVIQLIWALPGAIVVLGGGGYRYSPDVLREMEAELDQPPVAPIV